jgi:hypothetical protein
MPFQARFQASGDVFMSDSVFDPSLINRGAIFKPGPASGSEADAGRTFLISGLGRGGTTLVAKVLREAGLFIGEHLADLVEEDLEMYSILRAGQSDELDRLIARRNAAHRDWGFKLGSLEAYLRYADIARFRNPRLIVIFRDPVAIAVRGAIAEHYEPLSGLRDVVNAISAMSEFVHRTDCPSLLLSYEKAITFPREFVATLLSYCGITVDAEAEARILASVQPNEASYVQGARRKFLGVIEGMRDNVLCGWCCQIDLVAPVELDLFVNDQKVSTFKANQFRPDLLEAGYGNGNHGFAIDLSALASHPDVRLQLRVSGRTFELANSNRRVADYQSDARPAAS